MAYSKEIKTAYKAARTFYELVDVSWIYYTNIAFDKVLELAETRDQALHVARHTYGHDYHHGCHHAECGSDCDVRVVKALKRYYELPRHDEWSESDEDVAFIEHFVWSYEDLFKAKAQYHGFL